MKRLIISAAAAAIVFCVAYGLQILPLDELVQFDQMIGLWAKQHEVLFVSAVFALEAGCLAALLPEWIGMVL